MDYPSRSPLIGRAQTHPGPTHSSGLWSTRLPVVMYLSHFFFFFFCLSPLQPAGFCWVFSEQHPPVFGTYFMCVCVCVCGVGGGAPTADSGTQPAEFADILWPLTPPLLCTSNRVPRLHPWHFRFPLLFGLSPLIMKLPSSLSQWLFQTVQLGPALEPRCSCSRLLFFLFFF